MNIKILMAACALFLEINGIGLTFLSEEIAVYLKMPPDQTPILILQILGALYLGFAMLNGMAKNNLFGGIYSHPLVLGNLLHFLVSSFALIKITLNPEGNFGIILTPHPSLDLTLGFGYVFLTNPGKVSNDKQLKKLHILRIIAHHLHSPSGVQDIPPITSKLVSGFSFPHSV